MLIKVRGHNFKPMMKMTSLESQHQHFKLVHEAKQNEEGDHHQL